MTAFAFGILALAFSRRRHPHDFVAPLSIRTLSTFAV
jgi:hypothetical protein